MKKMKVAELSGALLDLWVAKAANGTNALPPWMLGRQISDCVNGVQFGKEKRRYAPSSDWADGGPIIEREKIATIPFAEEWGAEHRPDTPLWIDTNIDHIDITGPTPLIAAMRCFVASKFGEEVPDA